jgi:hypothetical protein
VNAEQKEQRMSLASLSLNVEHIAQRLRPALSALAPGEADRLARGLAAVVADLDHKLRADVDDALGRLEARFEDEIRELGEEEQ